MNSSPSRLTSFLKVIAPPLYVVLGVEALEMVWNAISWTTRFAGDPPFAISAVVASFAGIYFAVKFERAELAPKHARLTLLLAVLGFLLLAPFDLHAYATGAVFYANEEYVYELALVAVGLLLISRPWTMLRTLMFFGLVTRVPVSIFLFAMWPPAYAKAFGARGTALGSTSNAAIFKWAILPQIITWPAVILVVGMLTGAAVLVAMRAKTVAAKVKKPRRLLSSISLFLGVATLGCALLAALLSNPNVPRAACEAAQTGFIVTFLVALVAIVLGHVSRRKLAFICGYLTLVFVYFYPGKSDVERNACTGWERFYQAQAVGSLRTINTSEVTYASTYTTGFSASLAQLDGTLSPPTAAAAGLIDQFLASGAKNGYVFTYSAGPPDETGKITTYSVTARPTQPGHNGFYTDQTGVIRITTDDRPATVNDPPLAG